MHGAHLGAAQNDADLLRVPSCFVPDQDNILYWNWTQLCLYNQLLGV